MKEKEKLFLVNFISEDTIFGDLQIMRVLMSKEFTQLDFGYVAPWIYERGGWIRIAQHTHLKVQGNKKKYALLEAKNIPIAPLQLDFKSKQDWQVFSLIFEPLPLKDCVIDMIEEENPSDNDFNFYNIQLKNITKTPIIIHS